MIEKFQSFLKLRLRSNWEACDSGILIWRNSIGYILVFMGIPFILLVALLAFLNPQLRIFGTLIIWWLKPFFDRFILQVISVRFFRNDADMKRICQGLLKNTLRGLFGDITWRRFSIYRAARMPIRILEGNKGTMVSRRIRNLKKGGLDFCALLTSMGIVIEIGVFGGFAYLLYSFFGRYADVTLDIFSDYASQVSLAGLFIASLTFFIVEPLYMCMGFGIYINSREDVEGWDIELAFNSFIKDKQQPEPAKIKNGIMVNLIPLIISILMLFSLVPRTVQAEEWYQVNSEEMPAEVLDDVLASKDFGDSYTTKWVKFKERNSERDSPNFNFDFKDIKDVLGFILRALLVLAIVGVLVFAGYRLFKMRKTLFADKPVPWKKGIVPGFVRQEDPEVLMEEAKKLFAAGQIRKAWASCLSAALRLYADPGNIMFAPNDTESDCLVRINNSVLWGKEGSARLVLNWIKLAYAGIEPGAEQFHEVLSFCGELKNKLSGSGDSNE